MQYPRESCGVIVNDLYLPCENLAPDPAHHEPGNDDCNCQLCSFVISADVMIEHRGRIQMIVHSHPGGPLFPSRADAQGQLSSGVAWGVIALDEERTSDALVWGGDTPIAPIIGRTFMHYTSDCYTLIKDVFALGAEALKVQNINGWPYPPITLPECPREDSWWVGEDDLYTTEHVKAGFITIEASEARPGDVFLMSIRSDKLNHGGVLLDGGLILHHLPARLSRREPAGIWGRQVGRWLRYTMETENA
jgi:proteasome lid subunit RPN8/RPN11